MFIELICAKSPQAKGREERASQTLQDRRIKELKLLDISDYEQANRDISQPLLWTISADLQ